MKKKIKIKFVDFWKDFDHNNNEFIDVLNEKYNVILSDNPEYIFYSCFGYEHLKYSCIRIFYSGECFTPNFNECDYAISFDYIEFGDRYKRIPLYKLFQYKSEFLSLYYRPQFNINDLNKKTGFCSFVYSNCFAQDLRTQIFEKLSEYKVVSSGGRYKNNVGGAVKNKKEFQSKHKFAIAFENTSHEGYCTEKLMEAFTANCIPIYYGDPLVSREFNTKSFINCHDYNNLDEVINKIIEIDQNEELYIEMQNESPFNDCNKDNGLKDFLYNIFDQEYQHAFRRSLSFHPMKLEKAQLRHAFYEINIYGNFQKIKNTFKRIKTNTLISSKRNK